MSRCQGAVFQPLGPAARRRDRVFSMVTCLSQTRTTHVRVAGGSKLPRGPRTVPGWYACIPAYLPHKLHMHTYIRCVCIRFWFSRNSESRREVFSCSDQGLTLDGAALLNKPAKEAASSALTRRRSPAYPKGASHQTREKGIIRRRTNVAENFITQSTSRQSFLRLCDRPCVVVDVSLNPGTLLPQLKYTM